MNWMRRKFLQGSTLLGAGWLTTRTAMAQHEGHQMPMPPEKKAQKPSPKAPQKPNEMPATEHEQHQMAAKIDPATGLPVGIVPVHTPDLKKLPYTMDKGVKVFQLSADVVKTEFLPASHMGPARDVYAWGYNGSVPGPMIEVVEGDRVRIVFKNNLPEVTTVHWHGLEVPIEMDGVPYISQPQVQPGGTFTYEFTLNQNGTYFYHSHGAMQEMLGMIGMFVIHPKKPHEPRVDKDFGIILQGWAILPNNPIPNTLSMEFNWLTFNGKAGPATTPMIVKQGERVRIRIVNLGMDHHPIHLHGMQFYITGTEGGRIPETAWFPGNTVIVGVAQARDAEFDAKFIGDWMLHCHLPHHMMNQMVSMVGPMMMSHGSGSQTGKGMQEGMGMLRQGDALSDNFGPGFGRGMAMTTEEKNVSNFVGQQSAGIKMGQEVYSCPMHPEVQSDKPGKCPKCGMTLVKKAMGGHAMMTEEEKKKVPGYPQDMDMPMDEPFERKPEVYGMAPGWTAAMMGMMTSVRVLPEDKYNQIMAMVKEGKVPTAPAAGHGQHQAEIPADAIKITVSKDGFSPARLEVKAGQPLKLAFYRADAENCATSVVFPALKVEAKLPVGQTTLVEITPREKGELAFACGMNMFKGMMVVQ